MNNHSNIIKSFEAQVDNNPQKLAWVFIKDNLKGNVRIKQGAFRYENISLDIQLSKRQAECLFLILRGKTAKEISVLLKLSQRTIESYIDDLKFKLRVNTKNELLEIVTYKGYFNFIPKHWCIH